MPPRLADGHVHVWKAAVSEWSGHHAALRPLLDPGEAARVARAPSPAHAAQYLVAHALLRRLLGAYTGRDPSSLCWERGPAGKPSLISPRGAPDLQFSLAHSGDLVLVAAGLDHAIGVDVEQTSRALDPLRLAERFFSPAEREQLRALPEDRRLEGFVACWTRKEAYLKGTGQGVARGLESFAVTVAPDQPAELLADRRDPEAPRSWRLLDLEMGAGYRGAVAVENPECVVECFELGTRD